MLRALLLAAGRSTRFGCDKLLHPLPDGTPLVLAAARRLHAGAGGLLAVVSARNPALLRLLESEHIPFTVCPDAERGMGHSLAAGVRASAGAAGWLVALGDMPAIRPDSIAAVKTALEQGALLAAPVYRGRRGHPVGFSAALREDLLRLQGDSGARALLSAHRDALWEVECEDAGVLQDIDTPAALSELLSSP